MAESSAVSSETGECAGSRRRKDTCRTHAIRRPFNTQTVRGHFQVFELVFRERSKLKDSDKSGGATSGISPRAIFSDKLIRSSVGVGDPKGVHDDFVVDKLLDKETPFMRKPRSRWRPQSDKRIGLSIRHWSRKKGGEAKGRLKHTPNSPYHF